MRRVDVNKLALLSLTGGLLLTTKPLVNSNEQIPSISLYSSTYLTENQEHLNRENRQFTETDLLLELTKQGRASYKSLDEEGKIIALELANHGYDKDLAVKIANEHLVIQKKKTQEKMLHNGMDRMNSSPKKNHKKGTIR